MPVKRTHNLNDPPVDNPEVDDGHPKARQKRTKVTDDNLQTATRVQPGREHKNEHPGLIAAPKCHQTQAELEKLSEEIQEKEATLEALKQQIAMLKEEEVGHARGQVAESGANDQVAVVDHLDDIALPKSSKGKQRTAQKGEKVLKAQKNKATEVQLTQGLDVNAFKKAITSLARAKVDDVPQDDSFPVGGLNDEDADSGTFEEDGFQCPQARLFYELIKGFELDIHPSGLNALSSKTQNYKSQDNMVLVGVPPALPQQAPPLTPARKYMSAGSPSPFLKCEDSISTMFISSNSSFYVPSSQSQETEQKIKGKKKKKDLPPFLRGVWKKKFIPIIHAKYFVSKDPCGLSVKGDALVVQVQAATDLAVKNNTYKVELRKDRPCPVIDWLYDRLQETRSKVGDKGQQVVKVFFDSPEYKDNPEAIKYYARWALRTNGPAFFRIPIGPTHTDDPEHPDYQHGIDIFQSSFMIDTVKGFWELMSEADDLGEDCICVEARQYPKGLFALAAAAVERAFRCYFTGKYKKPGKFSNENIKEMVDDYMADINRFTEHRWNQLALSCGVNKPGDSQTEDSDVESDVGVAVGHRRRNLYRMSSPPAED